MVRVSLRCFCNFWNLGTYRLDYILEGPEKVWRGTWAWDRAWPSGTPQASAALESSGTVLGPAQAGL